VFEHTLNFDMTAVTESLAASIQHRTIIVLIADQLVSVTIQDFVLAETTVKPKSEPSHIHHLTVVDTLAHELLIDGPDASSTVGEVI
jgi:hypothetical protein